jgi:glycosyltransferase involved in cell wall biosynthesis
MKRSVFVNAIAATGGGALTILRQFLRAIPNKDVRFIIFTSVPHLAKEFDQDHVLFVMPGVKKGWGRLQWDYFGMKSWSKNNNVHPAVIISLQNTPVRFDSQVRQFVYVHQSIPLYDYRWTLFRRDERVLWFYKHIYPFFMRQNVSCYTDFICQAEWMRIPLAQLLGVAPSRLHVFKPHLESLNEIESTSVSNDEQYYEFFYPATQARYKNHLLLVDALCELRAHAPELFHRVRIKITIDSDGCPELVTAIATRDLECNFIFMGELTYEIVAREYLSCRAVLFPSYMETYGLPLAEAASLGRPVVCADLPYARETLGGYLGAKFVSVHSHVEWACEIRRLCCERPLSFPPLKSQGPSWNAFFTMIMDEI